MIEQIRAYLKRLSSHVKPPLLFQSLPGINADVFYVLESDDGDLLLVSSDRDDSFSAALNSAGVMEIGEAETLRRARARAEREFAKSAKSPLIVYDIRSE